MKKNFDIVLVSVNSPVLLGIYDDCNLIFSLHIEGKISDVLPIIFTHIFKQIDSINHYDDKIKLIKYDIFCDLNLSFLESKDSKNLNLNDCLFLLSLFSNFKNIYYARGVGSLSAIKLTHIFLHTLSLSKNIALHATNSFYFTQSNEIKAFGNMSFFMRDSKIDSKMQNFIESKLDSKERIYIAKSKNANAKDCDFRLPKVLKKQDFIESCTPLYITPAV